MRPVSPYLPKGLKAQVQIRSARPICLAARLWPRLKFFITCKLQVYSLGDVNAVIYDAEGARVGRYRCMEVLIWGRMRAHMGSRDWAIMDS